MSSTLMANFPPYLSYLGIGLAGIVGLLLLVWAIVALSILRKTKGLPQAIRTFLTLIVEGNVTGAYQGTTDNFKAKTSKQAFSKFIKKHKLHQYTRTLMSIPTVEGNCHSLDVTVITKTGQEIPLKMSFIKHQKTWQVEALDYNYKT
jgi:hypothetical protein